MTENTKDKGFIGNILAMSNDNPKKTIIVAFMLCLVCSVLVSTAAVTLKSKQTENKEADIKKNILAVTGLLSDDTDINEAFKQFDVKIVDLASGDYDNDVDPVTYDQKKASSDPAQSIKLTPEQDIAKIGRRAKLATVYILKDGDNVKQVILPIHGYGLWSTLWGFISFENDFNTIKGLRFYAHAETPGLGGEVDNPKWRAQWEGKKAFDENGNVAIKVIRGHVDLKAANAEYKVDGLSGATLTSQGVSNLVNYWLGDNAFGPYLKHMNAMAGSK
jgi:Na+-transporting NADH:ubiquinone oxidoreductase subunit C